MKYFILFKRYFVSQCKKFYTRSDFLETILKYNQIFYIKFLQNHFECKKFYTEICSSCLNKIKLKSFHLYRFDLWNQTDNLFDLFYLPVFVKCKTLNTGCINMMFGNVNDLSKLVTDYV